MRKSRTKGISFKEEYSREYEYMMTIKDASRYVCELIKADLDKKEKATNKVTSKN